MGKYEYIIQTYVKLIQKGKKTIDDVPEIIREEVKKRLEGNEEE